MKVTDIIRGVLDLIDRTERHEEPAVAVQVAVAKPVDDLDIIQQLAGLEKHTEYANEPAEIISPIGAAFPGGDDVHQRKNPADIRADSISMYPDWLARKR